MSKSVLTFRHYYAKMLKCRNCFDVENCQNVETADWLITRSENLFFDQKYCTTIQLFALYKIIFFLQIFKILLEMTTYKVKGKGGRPQNEVWDYYTQSERDSKGLASATCNFCKQKFSKGDVTTLQGHIANHCLNAPSLLIRKYQNMFEEKANKTNNKKRKNNQTSLHNYHDTDEQLSQGRIDRINRALLKLFVCCGISFRIVKSPFLLIFFMSLILYMILLLVNYLLTTYLKMNWEILIPKLIGN